MTTFDYGLNSFHDLFTSSPFDSGYYYSNYLTLFLKKCEWFAGQVCHVQKLDQRLERLDENGEFSQDVVDAVNHRGFKNLRDEFKRIKTGEEAQLHLFKNFMPPKMIPEPEGMNTENVSAHLRLLNKTEKCIMNGGLLPVSL